MKTVYEEPTIEIVALPLDSVIVMSGYGDEDEWWT